MMTSCIVPKSDDNQAVSNGFTIELKIVMKDTDY